MNQKQLEIFVNLADTLNFTRTSEYLYLSQTTVTLQIKNLEEELGVKLFSRTSRSVNLTAAGKTFLDGAKEILRLMEETSEKARFIGKEYTGLLEIGFATEANATGISDIIDKFASDNHNIRLRIYGGYPGNLMDNLIRDQYDIILGPTYENIKSEGLSSFSIGYYPLVAVFRKDHAFANKKSVKCEDFEGERMIYVTDQNARLDFTGQFAHKLEEKKIHTKNIASLDDIESVLIMLEAGFGITVLPEYFKGRFHGTSGLKICPIDEDLKGVTFAAMWKNSNHSKELETFIKHLKTFQK